MNDRERLNHAERMVEVAIELVKQARTVVLASEPDTDWSDGCNAIDSDVEQKAFDGLDAAEEGLRELLGHIQGHYAQEV